MSHLARIVSNGTPYAHRIRVGGHVLTIDEPAALGEWRAAFPLMRGGDIPFSPTNDQESDHD